VELERGGQIDDYVSIWSASYSLEKDQGSGGDVTRFTDQARTCTCFVHVD